MLLYPGAKKSTKFSSFKNEALVENHQCKMGFVSILDSSKTELREDLGEAVLKHFSE